MCYVHGLIKGEAILTNRQQRVRVNSNFSTWENIIAGVPQTQY